MSDATTGDRRAQRREYQRAYQARRRKEDPEGQRAIKRASYARHRESTLAKRREYVEKNRDAVRAWHREDYARNPDRKRSDNLRRKFGITDAEYDALLVAQAGRCAICRREPNHRRLAVDHDHETGSVRGLLCGSCNVTLGVAERPRWIDEALAYLARYRK